VAPPARCGLEGAPRATSVPVRAPCRSTRHWIRSPRAKAHGARRGGRARARTPPRPNGGGPPDCGPAG
jgi:hypothetical protein